MSSIGDICVIAGDKFVSLWTQDISHEVKETSYTQQIFYSSNVAQQAGQMGQVLETSNDLTSTVFQVEILGDGRMFFTLEEKSKHVKVWYQDRLREQSDLTVRMFLFQDLSIFKTKENTYENLLAFRIKNKSPNSISIEPAVLLTMSKSSISIHVESLMDTEMRFICFQQIKLNARIESFDAHFVLMEEQASQNSYLQSKLFEQQAPLHLSSNPVQPYHLSKIFDTHRDEELKFKKRQLDNKYGVIPQYTERPVGLLLAHNDHKLDYFLVAEKLNQKTSVTIYKCKGISNVPMRTFAIELFKKIQTNFTFDNILCASCYPNILRSTPQTDMIRLIVKNHRGSLFNVDYDVKAGGLVVVGSYALYSNTRLIELSAAHPDLKLLALVFDDEIAIYSGDQLYGTYKTTFVKSLQWLPGKNSFLILRVENSGAEVQLVSSQDSEFRGPPAQGLTLVVYQRLHKVPRLDSAIGIVISNFSEQEKCKLHFCTLHIDGSTSIGCFEFEDTVNTQVDFYELSRNEAYQDGHLVVDLVTQEYTNNLGYFLVHSKSQVKSRSGMSVNFVRLNRIDAALDRNDEVFKLEINTHHKIQAKISGNTLLVSVVEGDYSCHKHVLYIYNIKDAQYQGFIKLSEILGLQVLEGRNVCAIDFILNAKADQITVIAEQKAFLFSKQLGHWGLVNSTEVLSFVPSSVQVVDGFLIVQQKHIVKLPKLHTVFTTGSLPIYHPSLLKIIFFKGYPKQVAQILAEIYWHLQDTKSPLPDISRIKFLEEASVAKKKPFNMFGDLEDSESDSENLSSSNQKKEEKDPVALFNEKSDEIVNAIIDSEDTLNINTQEKLDLIEFIYKFRATFQMDFYADKLTVLLLNQVFFETEKTPASDIEYAKSLLGLGSANIIREQPAAKPFSMEELINQRMLGAHKSQADVSGVKDWSSKMINLALHSENQDVILDQLSQRLDFGTNLTWPLMRRLGIPLWLKSDFKLKQMIEIVAKNEYRLYEGEGNQLSQTKAEYAALWYVLTNKVSVLRQLFNVEIGGKKFAEFLESDFNQPKPRTIAGKNAMALVAKRKNLLACSFFLLAQDLPAAVQVALERCQDPILALVMCRVQDPNNELKQIDVIAEKYFIERGQQFNDLYLKSIGQWLHREYVKAVNELEPKLLSSNENMFQSVQEYDLTIGLQKETKKVLAQSSNEVVIFPPVAKVSFESLDMIVRLRKVPEVKRLLNKDWQVDKKAKKGGSIFDDFLGSGSSSEEEVQQKETITVDENLLFETLLVQLLDTGFNLIAILLIQERPDLNVKLSGGLKQRIARTILLDTCQHKKVQTNQITECIDQLQQQLKVEVERSVVAECLNQTGMFSVEMDFLLENSSTHPNEIFQRIDKQASPIIDFIHMSAQYSGQLFKSKLEQPDQRSEELLTIIKIIEEILEALILFDNQPTAPIFKKEPLVAPKISRNNSGSEYQESDDDDIQHEAVPNAPLTNKLTHSSKLIKSDGSRVSIIELLGALSFKCRIGVTLATAIFQICMCSSKISLVPETQAQIIQFLSVWNWTSATVTESLIKQNIEKLSFQSLKTLVQRVKISITKQIGNGTSSKLDRKDQKCVYYFAQDWLRYLACFGTMDQVLTNAIRILGNNKQYAPQSHIQVQSRDSADPKKDFMPSDLIQILDWQNRLFDLRSHTQFEHQLSLKQKRQFLISLNQLTSGRQIDKNLNQVDLRLIVKSPVKFKEFSQSFNLQKQQQSLEDLCLSSYSRHSLLPGEPDSDLLQSGIELFKQKGDHISDFQIMGDYLIIAMESKGMREISVGASLLYRSRQNNTLDLVDEELYAWYDCLHRFDNHQKIPVEPKLEAVRQAVLVHQQKKTFSSAVKQRQNQLLLTKDTSLTEFDGVPMAEYLKQRSSLEITHEDYTNSIAVHSKVPVYLTGNAKGIVCMWQIGQKSDRSLHQWICEPEIRPTDASARKSSIIKIEFTAQGDKFAALNSEGSLFIFSFEPEKNLALTSKKGLKISDFHLLDGEGTTVLALSQSNKTLMIIDLMTGLILNQQKVAGTLLQFDQVRQTIYTFNKKDGFIHRHDMGLQTNLSKQIGKEEITSSLQFGDCGKYLAVGFSDGTLKIFSLVDGLFDSPLYQINVFTSVNGKKGPVTSLRFSAQSGALYAATTLGCVKIVKVLL